MKDIKLVLIFREHVPLKERLLSVIASATQSDKQEFISALWESTLQRSNVEGGMQIDCAIVFACVAACNSGRIAKNHQIKKIHLEALAG